MIKKVLITCRQATLLMAKNEENKLIFQQKLKLIVHIYMCRFCRLFSKQTRLLSREAAHIHAESGMADEKLQKMEEIIAAELQPLD